MNALKYVMLMGYFSPVAYCDEKSVYRQAKSFLCVIQKQTLIPGNQRNHCKSLEIPNVFELVLGYLGKLHEIPVGQLVCAVVQGKFEHINVHLT